MDVSRTYTFSLETWNYFWSATLVSYWPKAFEKTHLLRHFETNNRAWVGRTGDDGRPWAVEGGLLFVSDLGLLRPRSKDYDDDEHVEMKSCKG